ncbi:MAG: hypothetical protein JST66_09865 [Bacteroidetes bacterium]|nr:hypothetical protein [Bacteroidota bacterium]
MNMRLLAAALVLCAATATYAQSASAHGTAVAASDTKADAQATAKAQASLLTTELGLDTKQAAEVEHLLVSAEEKAASLRTADAEKNKPSLEKLSESTYAQVKGLLNAEQGKKLDALKAAGKWQMCSASASSGKGCCAGGGHGAAAAGKPGCCAGKGAHAESAPAPAK